MELQKSALIASNDASQQKLPIEAPFRSWSFLGTSLNCLACIVIVGILAWKYPVSSASLLCDVLVMGWVLGSWRTSFRYQKKAHELSRKRLGLAIEGESRIDSNSALDDALRSATRAMDYVLFLMSMAVLLLLIDILFLVLRR